MGEIVLDSNKINSYVVPNLNKFVSNNNQSYELCSQLKNSLPNTFPYKTETSVLANQINESNNNIKKLNTNIKDRLDKVDSIESRQQPKIDNISSNLSQLGAKIGSTSYMNMVNSNVTKKEETGYAFEKVLDKNVSNAKNIASEFLKNFGENTLIGKILNIFKSNEKQESNKEISQNVNKLESSVEGLEFSEFSDYQNIMINYILNLQDQGIELGETGKTFNQIYDELIKNGNTDTASAIKSNLIDKGFGDLTVVEIRNGENGFDAVVLKDSAGNYMVTYPCTNISEMEDVLLDSVKIVDYLIDEETQEQLLYIADRLSDKEYFEHLDRLTFDKIPDKIKKNIIEIAKMIKDYRNYYSSQVEQAQQITNEYMLKAYQEGKTLNFSGYSLGGTLVEESVIYLYQIDSGKYLNVLDEVKLYDPYHANLTSDEIEIIKTSGDLKLYCAQGDMVSSIFNQKEFDGVTKYVYLDYKSTYDNLKVAIDKTNNSDFSFINDNIWITIFDGLANLDTTRLSDENLNSLKYFNVIFDGPHSLEVMANSIGEAPSFAFDENGNVRDYVIIKDEKVGTIPYKVEGVPFSEISNYVFGFDIKKTGAEVIGGIKVESIYNLVKNVDNLKESKEEGKPIKTFFNYLSAGLNVGSLFYNSTKESVKTGANWVHDTLNLDKVKQWISEKTIIDETAGVISNKVVTPAKNWVCDNTIVDEVKDGVVDFGKVTFGYVSSGEIWDDAENVIGAGCDFAKGVVNKTVDKVGNVGKAVGNFFSNVFS